MTTATLKLIKELLTTAKVNYSFQTMKSDAVTYPYWIGEFSEGSPDDESGYRQSTFILTGTTDNTWLELHSQKNAIEELFRNKKAVHLDNSAVAFFVENSFEVPTQMDKIKRIQLNIQVQEWRT